MSGALASSSPLFTTLYGLCALLADRGSCDNPIQVDTPTSLMLNPCDLWDSTASNSDDVVMLISPSSTARELTVVTSGQDSELYVFTECPTSTGSSSKVGLFLHKNNFGFLHRELYLGRCTIANAEEQVFEVLLQCLVHLKAMQAVAAAVVGVSYSIGALEPSSPLQQLPAFADLLPE